MANACVGPGFVINTDGSLGLAGPRAGTWPYGNTGTCSPANANGLRLDASTGKLWVEPPDLRIGSNPSVTASASTPSTSWQDFGFGSQTFTNTDPCRPTLLYGEVHFTWQLSSIPVGSGLSVAADIYFTTPPSPGSQTLRYYQPNMYTAAISDTGTLSLGFQVQVAAGASQQVWASAAYKLDAGTATFTPQSLKWAVEQLTYRASW